MKKIILDVLIDIGLNFVKDVGYVLKSNVKINKTDRTNTGFIGISFNNDISEKEHRTQLLNEFFYEVNFFIQNNSKKTIYIQSYDLIFMPSTSDEEIILKKEVFRDSALCLNSNEPKNINFKIEKAGDKFEYYNWEGIIYLKLNIGDKIIKTKHMQLKDIEPEMFLKNGDEALNCVIDGVYNKSEGKLVI